MIALGLAAKAAGGFIAKHWQPIAIAVAVAAVLALAYGRGVSVERARWEKRVAEAAAAGARETLRLVEKNYAITLNVTQVLDNERVVTQEILKKVNVYVPIDACPVDPGVRIVHDAAAAGEDPATRSRADAAPVEARALASTLAINYGRCRRDQARLVGLQQYVRDVCRPDGLVIPTEPPADPVEVEPEGGSK